MYNGYILGQPVLHEPFLSYQEHVVLSYFSAVSFLEFYYY